LLAYARALVAFSWTQHADARDAGGCAVEPWDAEAMSWSLLGALTAGYERLLLERGQRVALEELAGVCVLLSEIIDSDSLPDWNNVAGRTQADVIAALDEAAGRDLPPSLDVGDMN
jgi:hypothetical protein